MTPEEIDKIIQALAEAYKQAGRTITTAVLDDGQTQTLLVDNRREEDLN